MIVTVEALAVPAQTTRPSAAPRPAAQGVGPVDVVEIGAVDEVPGTYDAAARLRRAAPVELPRSLEVEVAALRARMRRAVHPTRAL